MGKGWQCSSSHTQRHVTRVIKIAPRTLVSGVGGGWWGCGTNKMGTMRVILDPEASVPMLHELNLTTIKSCTIEGLIINLRILVRIWHLRELDRNEWKTCFIPQHSSHFKCGNLFKVENLYTWGLSCLNQVFDAPDLFIILSGVHFL